MVTAVVPPVKPNDGLMPLSITVALPTTLRPFGSVAGQPALSGNSTSEVAAAVPLGTLTRMRFGWLGSIIGPGSGIIAPVALSMSVTVMSALVPVTDVA